MRRNMARPPYFMELMEDFERDIKTKAAKASEATHDKWIDDNDVTWWVHRWNRDCAEYGCAIHAPTEHHMIEWPQVMVSGTLVVRLCQHDVEHPDPDSLRFFKRRGQEHMGVHNCDGCCNQRPKPRGGETYTLPETQAYPAVKYPPGYTHAMHDCEICSPSPYGHDINDIPNGS
jgi:hypothetical protein